MEDKKFLISVFVIIALAVMVSFICGYYNGRKVGAMEVYKGNTSLVVDTDSCIVFK